MQNLVKDLPLHGRNDQTRHGGVNIMSYAQEGRYHEPPKKEHAGVLHLVHCWPMQGQKQKVSKMIINLYLLIYTPPENRVSTSLGTSQTSQRVLLKSGHIIILCRTLRQPLVSCMKPPSPIYTENIRRHLKLAYGFKRTLYRQGHYIQASKQAPPRQERCRAFSIVSSRLLRRR